MLRSERGATAVFVASSLLLLMGVTAVALDVGAAFNERNQNQNAGDNGVMAGAMDKADRLTDQDIVTSALTYVFPNLTADFPGGLTDPAWIAMWRGCVDAGNPGWLPLPEPASWGGAAGATLDCVSQTTSLLRVRIPNQLVDTTFGKVLGPDAISTTAVSIAKTVLQQTAPPVVPFGVAGSSGSGELCLASGGSGTSYAPCTGPQTGAFGSIISPLFGDFGVHAAQCTGNTNFWFERNVVWGIDHQIEEWSGSSGITPPAPYPGEPTVLAYADTNRDACTLDPDGNAAPVDGIPINTMLVDTGFPNPSLTRSLVSNNIYDGLPSRLQQGSNPRRIMIDKDVDWPLDNRGPWMYLTDTSTEPTCTSSYYSTLLDTAARNAAFSTCVQNVPAGEVVFDGSITMSPRFVWVPQYTFELPVSGTKFMPIRRFRAAFLGGVWFNCSSSGACDLIFYPDETVTTPDCDTTPGGCQSLTVFQISAWLLPDDALPASVKDGFSSAFDDMEAELYQ